MLEIRHIPGYVQLAAFDVFVQYCPLLKQEEGEDDHRQDRNHQANTECEQRRQVALPSQLQLQSALHRRKEDAKDHRPEHRAVERQQDPDERDSDHPQQNHQRFISYRFFVHVRSVSVRKDTSSWKLSCPNA
ncbi:hypothetical protein D3C80_1726830 [compost metagenome]